MMTTGASGERRRENNMYQCFHCLHDSVVWGADFTFEDYGMDGEGIVHSLHCANCGADIEYYVRIDDPEEEEEDE